MQLAESTSIAAPPERVWEVLMDVERWPEWTQSMSRLERLQPGELAVGSQVGVKQPKLRQSIYTVTALEPGRNMEWQLKLTGLRVTGGHRIEPEAEGSRVTLTMDQSGWLSPLIGLIYGGLTRRYVGMEARGLKARSEGNA